MPITVLADAAAAVQALSDDKTVSAIATNPTWADSATSAPTAPPADSDPSTKHADTHNDTVKRGPDGLIGVKEQRITLRNLTACIPKQTKLLRNASPEFSIERLTQEQVLQFIDAIVPLAHPQLMIQHNSWDEYAERLLSFLAKRPIPREVASTLVIVTVGKDSRYTRYSLNKSLAKELQIPLVYDSDLWTIPDPSTVALRSKLRALQTCPYTAITPALLMGNPPQMPDAKRQKMTTMDPSPPNQPATTAGNDFNTRLVTDMHNSVVQLDRLTVTLHKLQDSQNGKLDQEMLDTYMRVRRMTDHLRTRMYLVGRPGTAHKP